MTKSLRKQLFKQNLDFVEVFPTNMYSNAAVMLQFKDLAVKN